MFVFSAYMRSFIWHFYIFVLQILNMTNYQGNILVIDDDQDVLESAQMFLDEYFEKVDILNSPQKLSPILSNTDYDVILLDMNFQKGAVDGKEGLYWLNYIHEVRPNIIIILMTAFGDVDLAVKVMKEGAFDFIQKPWNNSKLLASVLAALKLKKSNENVSRLKETSEKLNEDLTRDYQSFIGESESIQKLKSTISKVASSDANVLILGDNGTGKDLVAQEIHRLSKRKDEAFIRVDLGSLPESLFESELFGYVKGAFTDAQTDKAGRFELASGGTIFLDEIGNLSSNLQSKILTAIQNRVIYRLGSSKEVRVDVRLICATNRPLKQLVKGGEFREDLFYRINTFELVIPPLKERQSDIPLLIGHFLKKLSKKYNKVIPNIDDECLDKLMKYNWPGNVRELQNSIERALIMNNGDKFLMTDFFNQDNFETSKNEDITNLDKVEKRTILKVLKNNNGNITNSARELGIHRNALYRRLEKYGL